MNVFDFEKCLKDIGNGVWAYMLPDDVFGLSNATLVVDEGESLLIDTLYDVNMTSEMLKVMRTAIPAAKTIDTLVNTHDNSAHWFGNVATNAGEIISTRTAATNMAKHTPADQARVMQEACERVRVKSGFWLEGFMGQHAFDNIKVALPTRTFEGCLDLQVGSKKVELIETGSVQGDLMVHIPHARTVVVADIVVMGQHQILWTGSTANALTALDKIISLEPEYIVSGHGAVTNIRAVLELKDYWDYYHNGAKQRFDKGMDSLVAAQELAKGSCSHYRLPQTSLGVVRMMYKEFSHDSTVVNQVEEFTLLSEC
ncbi:MAG: MBL fold metallo-hydrolase [Methyloprofundus sp.]|nr:MBL fold metallo-hydrolase [Methyloprofundus sp.]